MGNNFCLECIDCLYKEKPIEKKDAKNVCFCGYPFCNTDILKLDSDELLVKFNGSVYCSSLCRQRHKNIKYLGKHWNIDYAYL